MGNLCRKKMWRWRCRYNVLAEIFLKFEEKYLCCQWRPFWCDDLPYPSFWNTYKTQISPPYVFSHRKFRNVGPNVIRWSEKHKFRQILRSTFSSKLTESKWYSDNSITNIYLLLLLPTFTIFWTSDAKIYLWNLGFVGVPEAWMW